MIRYLNGSGAFLARLRTIPAGRFAVTTGSGGTDDATMTYGKYRYYKELTYIQNLIQLSVDQKQQENKDLNEDFSSGSR